MLLCSLNFLEHAALCKELVIVTYLYCPRFQGGYLEKFFFVSQHVFRSSEEIMPTCHQTLLIIDIIFITSEFCTISLGFRTDIIAIFAVDSPSVVPSKFQEVEESSPTT